MFSPGFSIIMPSGLKTSNGQTSGSSPGLPQANLLRPVSVPCCHMQGMYLCGSEDVSTKKTGRQGPDATPV